MFLIRPHHLRPLTQTSLESFYRRGEDHLARHFPVHYAVLGPEGTRELLAQSVKRAAGYGLNTEAQVLTFVNLQMALGVDFDSAPSTSWAGSALRDTSLPDPQARLDRAVQLAGEHLHRADQQRRPA